VVDHIDGDRADWSVLLCFFMPTSAACVHAACAVQAGRFRSHDISTTRASKVIKAEEEAWPLAQDSLQNQRSATCLLKVVNANVKLDPSAASGANEYYINESQRKDVASQPSGERLPACGSRQKVRY
jgi:hypothetical protein